MELNALKLVSSRIKPISIYCQKNIENLFVHMYGEVHTRQTGHFQQLYARTTKKQMCITIGGSKLWNSLETNLKEEINIHKLKTEACNYGFIHINFGLNLY